MTKFSNNLYLDLAKKAVERYIKEGEVISLPSGLPKEILERKAGVFVTIKKGSKLRGCIGTFLPSQENIAQEIIQNAIAACSEDMRFPPIEAGELAKLCFEVSVLGKLEQVKNKKELDPKKYGIFIKTKEKPAKSALLLPDLEGLDTAEKQLLAACHKAGINPAKEKITAYRFKTEKYDSKEKKPKK